MLVLAIAAISTISYDSLYDLGNINLLSLSIFIFPLLFFLLGLLAVCFSVRKIRDAGALLWYFTLLILLMVLMMKVE